MRRVVDVLGDGPSHQQGAGPIRGQVLPGERGDHARHRAGRGEIHALDGGVSERASDDLHPHHSGEDEVIGVAGLAGDELGVFLSRNRLADVSLGHGGHQDRPPFAAPAGAPARTSSATDRMAETMFW